MWLFKMKKAYSFIIRLLISITIIILLIYWIGIKEIIETFNRNNLIIIPLLLILYYISFVINTLNIGVLLDKINHKIKPLLLFKYSLISWSLGLFVPGTRYSAQEHVFIRIPLQGLNITFMDVVIPIVNRGGKSIQGVASFLTYVPYAIPETFVERKVGWGKFQLFPHNLVIDQKLPPKQIIKENLIKAKAVNRINSDGVLNKLMHGSDFCYVSGYGSGSFKITFDWNKYPPGTFTIVPYNGYSVMISKDAGINGTELDKPRYNFANKCELFDKVSRYLNENPEYGIKKGKFYLDTSLEFLLAELIPYFERNNKFPNKEPTTVSKRSSDPPPSTITH